MKRLAGHLFAALALVGGILSILVIAATVRSFYSMDEYCVIRRQPYPALFVYDDMFSRDTSWVVATGKAGISFGIGVFWNEPDNPPARPFGYHFTFDSYETYYPIMPAQKATGRLETRLTLWRFQFVNSSWVNEQLPTVHPIQPLKRDGKSVQPLDGLAVYAQPRVPREQFVGLVSLPLPLLLVLTAAPPLWWGRRTIRRRRLARRRAAGDCLGCGYPLCHTPDAPHCPECGLAAASVPS